MRVETGKGKKDKRRKSKGKRTGKEKEREGKIRQQLANEKVRKGD